MGIWLLVLGDPSPSVVSVTCMGVGEDYAASEADL